jgi:elongation factor Ts
MLKAKEALLKHDNNYEKALLEINSQTVNMDKLNQRIAYQGLIGVNHHELGFSSALVELNCETDFVAKNELFASFCSKLAETSSLIMGEASEEIIDLNIDEFGEKKLIGSDFIVNEELKNLVGKLKEKINIRRGFIFNNPSSLFVTAAYSHSAGTLPPGLGRLGSVIVLRLEKRVDIETRKEITMLAKKIAQHVSGFNPVTVNATNGVESESVLMNQPFLFGGGSIAEVLQKFQQETRIGLTIQEFKRVECGEGIEKKSDNFAEEVRAQIIN